MGPSDDTAGAGGAAMAAAGSDAPDSVSAASAVSPASGFSASDNCSDEEEATRGCEARAAGETSFSSLSSDEDEGLERRFRLGSWDATSFTLSTAS